MAGVKAEYKSIDFDRTMFFKLLDSITVLAKKILTRLGLRDKQSCKKCGRNQCIVWAVSNEIWNMLPDKWRNKALCLECFINLYPGNISKEDVEILDFLNNPRSGAEVARGIHIPEVAGSNPASATKDHILGQVIKEMVYIQLSHMKQYGIMS